MALQPTDLLAVRRGTVTYKAPFSQIQDYITDKMKATWLPSHLDDPSGIGVSTWNGPADTLTATPDVEVSIAGGAYGTGGAVGSPSEIKARWIASAVTAAAHAAVLTGRIENAAGNVGVDYSCTIDKLPGAITINAKTDVQPSAATDSDSSSAVAGLNAPARLWLDSTDGTLPMVSIAGNAWVAVPTTAATGLAITQGQTFKLRHTAQAGASTVTTTTVRVGWDATSSAQVAFATTNVASKAPVIGTVVLADSPEAGRFTSGTFATTVTMTDEGSPASTKGLKAWVEGTLNASYVTDEIIASTPFTGHTYDSYLTSSSGWLLYQGPKELFDGIDNATGGVSGSATFTPVPAMHITTSLELITEAGNLQAHGGQVNYTIYGPWGSQDGRTVPKEWFAGKQVDRIEFSMNMPNGNIIIKGIIVDGVKLKNLYPGTIVQLKTDKDLTHFNDGEAVTHSSGSAVAAGSIQAIDVPNRTINIKAGTGTWNVGAYVVGPPKPQASARLYVLHDATGAVSDLQSADPGYVTMTGNSPYTLTWPATLPSGNPPDTDLPAGTTITTDVQATNTAGTVTKTSNTVTPA